MTKKMVALLLALLMVLSLYACGASTRYYQQRADLYMYNERLDGFSRAGGDCYITVSGKNIVMYHFGNTFSGEWLKDGDYQFILWDTDPYIWADFEYCYTTMEKVSDGYNMIITYIFDPGNGNVYLEDRYQFRK